MDTKPKTIVFIEDDEVVLLAYCNRLRREGFHVEVAKDGLEAMKILLLSLPDLIVLDLMLPKFNGQEVLKFIRKDRRLKPVPVIILSSRSILDAEDEPLLEAGATRRLLKENCTPATLATVIRDALAENPAGSIPVPGPTVWQPAA